MKKTLYILAFLITSFAFAQVHTVDMLNLEEKTTAEMNAITIAQGLQEGSRVDNTDTNTTWRYNGTIWVDLGTGGASDYDLLTNKPLTLNGSLYETPLNRSIGFNTDDGSTGWVHESNESINNMRSVFNNTGTLWSLDPIGLGDSMMYDFTTELWSIPQNTRLAKTIPTINGEPASKLYVDNQVGNYLPLVAGVSNPLSGDLYMGLKDINNVVNIGIRDLSNTTTTNINLSDTTKDFFIDPTTLGADMLSFNKSGSNWLWGNNTLATTADITTATGDYLPLAGGTITGGLIVNGNLNTTNILPLITGTYNLGASNNIYNNVYASRFYVSSNQIFTPTDTEPGTTEGMIYFDDSESTLKQYNGTAWEALNGTTGDEIYPSADDTGNIGSANYSWGSIYTGEIRIQDDNSTADRDWWIQTESGNGDLDIMAEDVGHTTNVVVASIDVNGTPTETTDLITKGYADTNYGSGAYLLLDGSNQMTGSLVQDIGGNYNTAIGTESLDDITTGSYNVAIGYQALDKVAVSGNYNIAIGWGAGSGYIGGDLTASSESIYIGNNTTASANTSINEVIIGTSAVGNGNNTVTIGNSSTTATYLEGTLYVDGALIDETNLDTSTNTSLNLADTAVQGTISGRTGTTVTEVMVQTQSQYDTDGAPSAGEVVFISDAIDTLTTTVYLSDISTVLSTGTSLIYWDVPFDIEILNIKSSVLIDPATTTCIVDVNKNGTTLYTTQGNRPTIAIAAFRDTSAVPDVTTAVEDDRLTFDIDQVGTDNTGLSVTIYYYKT